MGQQGAPDVTARKTWPLEAPSIRVVWPDDSPGRPKQPSATMTLREFYKLQYLPKRGRGNGPLTDEAYECLLNNLARWAGREILASELTEDLIAEYLHWRRTKGDARRPGHGVGPATANKDLRHIRALWRFARRKKLVAGELDVDPETLPDVNKSCWSTEELAILIAAARQVEGRIMGLKASAWWESLLLVLYDAGGRIGATMAAKWADIKLPPASPVPMIILRHDAQKQKADQVLTLGPETAEALRQIGPRAPDELVWPWPHDPPDRRGKRRWGTLRKHYRKILAAAGLPADRDDMFHRVRRTSGTYTVLVEGSIRAAQERLGHSHQRVTLAYLDREKLEARTPTHPPLPRPQLPPVE